MEKNHTLLTAATVQKITLFDEIKGLIEPEFRF
jgi:hypothetical protein